MSTSNETMSLPQRDKRQFIPEDFEVNTWSDMEVYAQDLLNRNIQSLEDLQKLLLDSSEFDKITEEDARWRHVKTSVDTTDETAKKRLEDYILNLSAKYHEFYFAFSKKVVECPFTAQLGPDYAIYIRGLNKEIEIFRPENIEISQQESLLGNEYDSITGVMTIQLQDKEYAISQANAFMKSTDRTLRQEVFEKIIEREYQDKDKLSDLLEKLVVLRNKKALNANYTNFRDYQFDALGRFDYTAADCKMFHESIAKAVVPILEDFDATRKANLQYESLKPWDLEVDESNKKPLKPFETVDEFVSKTIDCLNRVDPFFGSRLDIMKEMNYLDLDARMGKANGGYNMTMPEMGVPFVFMNANMSETDIRVMTHEMGHAVHTFLSHPLLLNSFKSYPSEIAELASMSMELFCMEHWDVYYTNEEDKNAAKKRHLKGIFKTFTGVCIIDSLQHWMYENPTHTAAEREAKYLELSKKYTSSVVDWSGYEKYRSNSYQKVLHIYHVPFYYIEYAYAQLGAIAMYKQYMENPTQAIANYKKALSLGYTHSIGEVFAAAGIKFDFSEAYITEMMQFLKASYDKIK
ncbi:MAG: M3 family oligoendopeptidase [Bacteroidota bacterium]